MTAREQFDARRFAKMVARFDLCNGSEAEAMNGARMLRREAARDGGGRLVDLFYRADVMAALDNELQPQRQASAPAACDETEGDDSEDDSPLPVSGGWFAILAAAAAGALMIASAFR